jgi:hypothetical protein
MGVSGVAGRIRTAGTRRKRRGRQPCVRRGRRRRMFLRDSTRRRLRLAIAVCRLIVSVYIYIYRSCVYL